MAELQLEDLLRQLHEDGQKESSGAFSIDLEKATPKLRKFLLQNPFHYGLKLVQAGVAAGAVKIVFDIGDKGVTALLSGAGFEYGSMSIIFHYLLDADTSGATRAYRHLAIGINALVSLGASRIVVSSWDGARGYKSRWRSGDQKVSDFQESPQKEPYLKLEMTRSGGEVAAGIWRKLNRDVIALASARRSTMDREQGSIIDRCFCCPVPTVVNGRLVSRSYRTEPLSPIAGAVRYASDVACLQVPASDARTSGLRLPGPWTSEMLFAPEGKTAAGERCLAVLLLSRHWPRESDLLILEDGVLLGRQQLYLGHPGVTALICGSAFTLDLTGLVLSRDEVYLRNLAALSRWADDLRAQIHAHWTSHPDSAVWVGGSDQLAALLPPRPRRLTRAGDEPRAEARGDNLVVGSPLKGEPRLAGPTP